LPSDDKITLSAKSGFSSDLYHYQYKLPNDIWRDINNSDLYNSSKNKLILSAKDLLGDNYINYLNKNIQIRVVSCKEGNNYLSWSDAVTLTIIPSAPHIESVTYEMPTCRGNSDAKLHIKFDRRLKSDEIIYIAKNNNELDASEYVIGADSIVTLEGLTAQTYNLRVYGTIGSPAPRYNTYSDDAKHKFAIYLPNRPAVTYSIVQDSVHCYNGADGKIKVTAQGGAGKYRACLFADGNTNDTLQTVIFTNIAYFTELKTGNYTVHLRDTNNCAPSPLNLPVTVLQPNAPVQILASDFYEPRKFGASNGKAWAYITGGTMGTPYYNVLLKDSANMDIALEPDSLLDNEDGSIKALFENLKKGTYYFYVYDKNYSKAAPQTDENTCNCAASDTVHIPEPPLLTVETYETHYVTCNGDNDGELTAHGDGGRPHLSGLPYDYEWYKITASGDSVFNVNDSVLADLFAGKYKVNITDRYGIDTTSQVFELLQPDVLQVSTQVLKHILCDGEPTGKIEAFATGGTPPYTYIWTTSNRDTTRIVSGLPDDIYTVFVRDARYLDNPTHYCSASALAEIVSPSGLKIEANIAEPTCNGYSDGAISLQVTGGAAPYSCLWEDGSTAQNRENLPNGNYNVTLTDGNGCKAHGNYTLSEPPLVSVDLGKDITLSKNQKLNIFGEIKNAEEDDIFYKWTDKNNNILSVEKYLEIGSAGVYRLQITTDAGCTATDEIAVAQSDFELHSDFVIATKIPNNTLIYAVNIMQTPADSVKWLLPDNALINENLPDRVYFSIMHNGIYDIGLAAYKGDCQDILYKTIEVVNDSEIDKHDEQEPFVKNFVVYPNPNNGNFSVKVELSKPADYTLRLCYDSGVLLEAKEIKNKINEETQFAGINTGSGVYFLHFVCNSEKVISVYKVIIQ
jgi:hypothetical protein